MSNRTYIAFCRKSDGTGSIWIQTVEAESVEDAKVRAIVECAADWGMRTCFISCIGIAEGDINILFWEDI